MPRQVSVEGSWRSCRGRFALDPAADLLTSHTVYNQRFAVPLLHQEMPLLHLAVPLLHLAVPLLHLAVPLLHLAVPLLHLAVPLLHPAVPLLHLAVPLLHLAVPLLHLAVSLLHLAVPLLHIDSRRWSLEIEGKYMVAHCVSRLNLFSPVTTRPYIWTIVAPRVVGLLDVPPPGQLVPLRSLKCS
jgi:hypothetical protein